MRLSGRIWIERAAFVYIWKDEPLRECLRNGKLSKLPSKLIATRERERATKLVAVPPETL